MTVQILGTGNMAWFMALRLFQAGHTIETIYGRQRLEAARLANQVKARAVSEIKELQETDLCLVAVSDGAIAELAESLSFEHSLVVHHAGSVPIQVLAPCSPNRGVLWPILSIHKSNTPTIRPFPIAWEASNPASAQILLDLIDDLGARAWELYSPQRSALHLAAVMGNNFVAHLLSETRAYCKEKDLPFALLKPLVEMTIEQAFSDSDPGSLLTGPARRGDQRILESHQKMLADQPALARLYEQLSQSIQETHPRTASAGSHPSSTSKAFKK